MVRTLGFFVLSGRRTECDTSILLAQSYMFMFKPTVNYSSSFPSEEFYRKSVFDLASECTLTLARDLQDKSDIYFTADKII